jgi:outer membrane protein assembly factor BamB
MISILRPCLSLIVCLLIWLYGLPILYAESPKIMWYVPISHDGDVNGLIPLTTYKSGILCLSRNYQGPIIEMKEQKTGRTIWFWKDSLWNRSSSIRIDAYHTYQNILVLQHSRKIYHINLDNGKLIKEILENHVFTGTVVGMKKIYCLSNFTTSLCNFYLGDIKTGKQKMIVSIKPNRDREVIYPGVPQFVEYKKQKLLLLPFRRHDERSFQEQGYLRLYNFSKQKEIYTIPLNESSTYEAIQSSPIIVKNKVFMAVGTSIICHDLMLGKLQWRTKFPSMFMYAGIIYADGKIIGNCEDTNMYALDPETGKILWREKTAGTSRTPFYMNGVAYLAGNGDGLLHAVDTKIGEHLWRVICPEKGGDASFFGYVTGANGKIFVCSFGNLYCFKAAR